MIHLIEKVNSMQLSQIKDFLIYDFKSESELIRTIDLLSKNFTQNRDKVSQYLDDPKMVAAYTAFYMLTNYPKLEPVLDKVQTVSPFLKDRDIIDIGCGPGTFLLALRDLFKHNPNKFIGVETSHVMRKQAMRLASGLGYKNVSVTENVKNIRSEKPAIIFGHSINEMGADVAFDYIKKLDPEVVLIIEPGTKQAFTHLMELREKMLLKGFNIAYPCPSQKNCPMREDDWCHQYIHVRQGEEVSRIGQMTKKNRNLLPLTIHVYSRQDQEVSQKRIVRYYQETKHSYEYQTCEFDGKNILKNIQLTKREMSKSEIKNFKGIYAGDSISYELIKELKDGTRRVKLIKP